MERAGIALEEYKALRAEILTLGQSQTTLVSVALTATGLLAGFAFGAKAGDPQRLEILLALPLVLSGLGLAYLTHSTGALRIGAYTRTRLWPELRDVDAKGVQLPSWEDAFPRRWYTPLLPPSGWLTWLPGIIIFGAPSIAALVINWDHGWMPFSDHGASPGLEWAWFLDAVVTGLALLLLILSGIIKPSIDDHTSQGASVAGAVTERGDQ